MENPYNPVLLDEYKFANRNVPYMTETYELNDEEEKRLKELKSSVVEYKKFENSKEKRKIIIDTDIGTDIDDAMALLYALHLKESINIIGITTNYGLTENRAKIAKLIVETYRKCYGKDKEINKDREVKIGEQIFTIGDMYYTGCYELEFELKDF